MSSHRHFGLIPRNVRREPIRRLQFRIPFDVGAMLFVVAVYLGMVIGYFWFVFTARSQDSHDLHHAQYQNWISNEGLNCCNDKDCGTLADSRVREIGGHIEVLVLDAQEGDQWCPVESRHLVNQKNGKRPSPDWTMDHACIVVFATGGVCERLKCFMENGKF